MKASSSRLSPQDSRHGAKVLAGSKVGFCLRPQDEIDAGVTGLGGGEVLTQLATGVRHQG